MTSRTVELHPDSAVEVEQARRWYAERSPIAAHTFLVELDHSIEHVAQFPERWPHYLSGTRRYAFPRFPFSLIYRIEAESLIVIAVSHNRRRPGYWASRDEAQIR